MCKRHMKLTRPSINLEMVIMTSSNGNIFRATSHFCGNSVTGEFPAQRPVTRSFDVLFDLLLNTRLSKQSWGWWFETPAGPLWHHCNVYIPWEYTTAVSHMHTKQYPMNMTCIQNGVRERFSALNKTCDIFHWFWSDFCDQKFLYLIWKNIDYWHWLWKLATCINVMWFSDTQACTWIINLQYRYTNFYE